MRPVRPGVVVVFSSSGGGGGFRPEQAPLVLRWRNVSVATRGGDTRAGIKVRQYVVSLFHDAVVNGVLTDAGLPGSPTTAGRCTQLFKCMLKVCVPARLRVGPTVCWYCSPVCQPGVCLAGVSRVRASAGPSAKRKTSPRRS